MFNRFLSLFVSVQVSDAYVNTSSIIVFFSLNTEWVGGKKRSTKMARMKHLKTEKTQNEDKMQRPFWRQISLTDSL